MGHSPGDVTEGIYTPPIDELYKVLIAAEEAQLTVGGVGEKLGDLLKS
jgi:hypothetical protein